MLAGKVLAWRCTVLVPRKMSWSFYLNLGVLEFVSINLRICCPSVLHAIIWFLQGKYFASKLNLTSIPFEINNLKRYKCRLFLSLLFQANGIWRMVDNQDLIKGSDGWAYRPRRGRGQRQHSLGIRRERCPGIPSTKTGCGMIENLMAHYC